MANYYTIVVPEDSLRCSKLEAEEIIAALVEAEESGEPHGFEFEYHEPNSDGALLAPEVGSWGSLPEAALKLIGSLISKNNLPWLEFGAAFTADRLIYGSHGGTAFRIMPDGSIVERKETWPEDPGR